MTFEIFYSDNYPSHRGWCLFDIEYYQIQSERDKGKWHSEIRVLPCVEGLIRFYDSKKNDANFNMEEFIQEAKVIQELRRWLWEVDGNKAVEDNYKIHYGKRYETIKKGIDEFAKKYDLLINID